MLDCSRTTWQGLLVILDILTHIFKELEGNNSIPAIESLTVDLDDVSKRVSAAENKPDSWVALLVWLSDEGWEKISHRLMELLEFSPSNLNPEILKRPTPLSGHIA